MTFQCELTGKKPTVGNKVSHSNRKTRRRWLPNLQEKRVWVPELKQSLRLRLSTHAIKIIEKRGGLVQAIHGVSEQGLSEQLKKIKRLIRKRSQAKAKKPQAEQTKA